MKILLLQLPIQGHDFFFSHENIPLAASYLKAIANELGHEAEILPSHIMNYGCDQSIIQYIIDFRPDIIGMSCYLWNIERTLFISREIKRQLPQSTIILGGPEITPENGFLLSHNDFDIGVVGEGEWIWKVILQSYPEIPKIPGLLLKEEGTGWYFTGNNRVLINLDEIPSPFLLGALNSSLKGVLWLESVRGCRNRCAYCYYHKNYPRPRAFSLERVINEIKEAWNQNINEIVFLDPCFNRHPQLKLFLERIAEININKRLKFYAEGEVQSIERAISELMSKTGFVEMEVGLQSINQEALKLIHRRFHPRRFLQGIRLLQKAGVEVMVDLIVGLPKDTLHDIVRGIEWVMENNAYDYLMLYPLSLIHSTELYQKSDELGLKAMTYPPYFITKTQNLNAEEIHQAFIEYEKYMEEEISPLEMPIGLNNKVNDLSFLGGLNYFIDFGKPENIEAFKYLDETAYSLTIKMSLEVLRMPEKWFSILRGYLEKNPFSIISIEVPPDIYPDELNSLFDLARKRPHILDRDYTVTHTPYRSFLIFTRDKGLIWKWPDPREWTPIELSDGQKVSFTPVCSVATDGNKVPSWLIGYMENRYKNPPEIRLWQLAEDYN